MQWEVSSNGGTTFSAISGATSTTYSFTATAADNGNQYEAVFTNASGSATTTAATLTVGPPRRDHEPGQPRRSVRAARRPSRRRPAAIRRPRVQWEVSTNGGDDLQRHLRRDLDHLQLHGNRRGKRQPVRGRLHQQSSARATSTPATLTVDYRPDRDHEPGQPDGQSRAARRPSRRRPAAIRRPPCSGR